MFGHREQDARELSGEGDGSNAFASSNGNAVGPLLESFALRVSSAQNATGALDQERAESAAVCLGDVPRCCFSPELYSRGTSGTG
jgi:hypothetical protein